MVETISLRSRVNLIKKWINASKAQKGEIIAKFDLKEENNKEFRKSELLNIVLQFLFH